MDRQLKLQTLSWSIHLRTNKIGIRSALGEELQLYLAPTTLSKVLCSMWFVDGKPQRPMSSLTSISAILISRSLLSRYFSSVTLQPDP